MIYKINTSQIIKSDLDTVWNFISSPKNLAVITPDYLQFKILNAEAEKNIYSGQIIEYTIKPLLNLKLHWVTEITHVKDKVYFVDEQRFGPYAFWHHKHDLKAVAGGVEMTDQVHYKLPYGPFGQLAHALVVKKQVHDIFEYRFNKLEALFN